MNPILPLQHFVPDGEAREMPDGRLYLYGSYDISGESTYCSEVLHVFSTEDMENWVDHGVAFQCSDVPWTTNGSFLYAPDCVEKDGTYYLYFCLSDGSEGVAKAKTPYGPFQDPVRIVLPMGEGIDPAVLVDDDGEVYYFWGQFHLYGAKMSADMHTLIPGTELDNILDEKRHGFHEGASIRKYNGKYYLIYTDTTRGRATCFGYAVADQPLGPYEKKGIIIDNTGCDPQTWNNHGCITAYKGQWYVFYHRSSQNSKFNRRMCVEPIRFEADGTIREVTMTSQGAGAALKIADGIPASAACRFGNGVYLHPVEYGVEAMTEITDGTWAAIRYVEFSGETECCFTAAASVNGGTIEVWADDECIGCCQVTPTGGWDRWQKFACELKPVYGVKTLYLVFRGGNLQRRLMEVKEISGE